MSELQHSLHSMGVVQYLLAVTFLICYALALGDFLGPGARFGVGSVGLLSAGGFSVLADYWVHGVLLTVFVVVGMGLFIGLAWLLKTLVMVGQRRHQARLLAAAAAVQQLADDGESSDANPPLPSAPDAAPFTDGYLLADEHGAIDHAR